MKLKQFWSSIALLLLCALGCTPSRDISGAWSGTLNTGHLKLQLVFHVKHAGNGYKGTLDLIDQGRKDISATSVKVKGHNIHINLSALNAVYDATIGTNAIAMTGTFRQAGAAIPLALKKTAHPPVVADPLAPACYIPRDGSDLQGYWTGTLTNVNVPTRIALKISDPSAGRFRGELDSIDQGASGIPVTTISYQSPNVHIEAIGVAATFDGGFNRASGEITGTWQQGPSTAPLTLKRTSPPAEKTKP
jgi:uncharacterized protein